MLSEYGDVLQQIDVEQLERVQATAQGQPARLWLPQSCRTVRNAPQGVVLRRAYRVCYARSFEQTHRLSATTDLPVGIDSHAVRMQGVTRCALGAGCWGCGLLPVCARRPSLRASVAAAASRSPVQLRPFRLRLLTPAVAADTPATAEAVVWQQLMYAEVQRPHDAVEHALQPAVT